MTSEDVVKVRCIKCDKAMANILGPGKGHQPSEGLAFYSQGHYGSTFFDPMDGSYIEISVCDRCIENYDRRGLLFRSKTA
jgi:hypothetical protein